MRARDGTGAKVPSGQQRSGPKGMQTAGMPASLRQGRGARGHRTDTEKGRAVRRVVPDPEIGAPKGHRHPHTAGPDADLTPRPPVPPEALTFLP